MTNALQYLPHADNILWVDGGRIRGQGSYQQLVQQVRGPGYHCLPAPGLLDLPLLLAGCQSAVAPGRCAADCTALLTRH